MGGSHSIGTDIGIVVENGVVVDAGKYEEVTTRTVDARTLEFDGIVCPALINAHTHLELSPFNRVPHSDFVDWVLHLVAERYSRLGDDLNPECSKAKSEAEKSGTSYFVNVGNDLKLNGLLGKNQLFQFEQIGINDAVADSIFKKAVSSISGNNGSQIALAIHAPYSTSPSLMKKIKSFNNERNLITSIHLAETEDEVEFIRTGRGRMVDLLNSRVGVGGWSFGGTGLSPVEYVDSLGVLDEKTLCVHGVFVSEKDVEILKRRKCGVAVCVRSNRNLTGVVPDVPKFVKSGIKVMLGTDSKASSPDIDMFAEMSAFYQEFHYQFDPAVIFRMATSDPSDFLGIRNIYGGTEIGKKARLVYVPYTGQTEDAFEFVVADANGKTEAVNY